MELIHNSGITGPGRIVLGLAKYINREEFVLDVLCPENGVLPDDLSKVNTRVIPFAWKNTLDFGNFLRLRSRLRAEKYHVFHIHSGQLNAFAKIMALSLGIPVVVITEHMAVSGHKWIRNKFKLFLHLLLHRLSDSLADKVIAVSESSRKAYIIRQKVSSQKAVTIYNGVDFAENLFSEEEKNKIRLELGIPLGSPVLAVIGRLSPEKGHKVFVLAAREIFGDFPHARFLIIGEGPQRPDLEKLIAESGLKDKFILTGFMENVVPALEIADIVIQPSLESGESFGLSAAEAMARGKPVIVSDIDCFKEIIQAGQNGLFFRVGEHLSLAEKFRVLLNDSKLRAVLGAAGRQSIRDKFDIRFTAVKIGELYKNLLRLKGFILYQESILEAKKEFLNKLRVERSLDNEKIEVCGSELDKFLAYIQGVKRNNQEVAEYLERENIFLVETFLLFIRERKIYLDKVAAFNFRLFERQIRVNPVSAKDYDERVHLQDEQFQIDSYYLPKIPALKNRVDLILKYLAPREGERILDLGCGVGTFAFHCAKNGAVCAAVDYSQESLEMAKKLIARFGLENKVEFKCCDISNGLPFADGAFNKIISADFVEHIDYSQKLKMISELYRLLAPEGKAIIFTPNLLRELLGAFKSKLTGMLGGAAEETRLHFGLTSRFSFEKMLRRNGFNYKLVFLDVDRPALTKIPLLKEVLSLNLLWVVEKKK